MLRSKVSTWLSGGSPQESSTYSPSQCLNDSVAWLQQESSHRTCEGIIMGKHTEEALQKCIEKIECENPNRPAVALHEFDSAVLSPSWMDAVASAVKDNRHISIFSLRKLNAFTGEYVSALSVLTSMNLSLRVLELSACCITDETLRGIIGPLTNHPALKELNLVGNFLTDAAVLVTLLKYNKSIERLEIALNNYGSTVEKLWAVLPENTTLRYLNVSCNAVTDESMQALIPLLRENAVLESVAFEDNPKVSRESGVRLQQLLDMGPQRVCKAFRTKKAERSVMTDELIDYESMYRKIKFELFEVRKELVRVQNEKEKLQESTQSEILELRQRLHVKDNEIFNVEQELVSALEKNVALDTELTELRRTVENSKSNQDSTLHNE